VSEEVSLKVVLKTFGQKTHQELQEIIEKALWHSPDLRDVMILEFESSAPSKEDSTLKRLSELAKKDLEDHPYIPKPQT